MFKNFEIIEVMIPDIRINLRNKHSLFYYGWVIVAVSFLTIFLVLGTRSSFGLFYAAILQEYGWSRAETAGAFSLMMIIHSMTAPMTGILIDCLGPRMLFPLAALFLTIGLATSSFISQMWHFYICVGVVMAIGTNMLSYAPHMSLIPRWFSKKKGLASGLVLSGIGLGTLAMALLNGFIINTLGWRQAFLILGAIIFFIVIPVNAIFQRSSPKEIGQGFENLQLGSNQPSNAQAKNNQSPSSLNGSIDYWSFKTALRTISFWSLNATGFFQGFYYNTIVIHLAVYILDTGFSSMLAASSIGIVGLLTSVGGIILGLLSDRMGREKAGLFGCGSAVFGIILLLFIRESSSVLLVYVLVISYGLGQGGMMSITAATTGDLFSGGALGRIMSMQSVTFGFGSALGVYLGGHFYDRYESYIVTFIMVLIAIILSYIFIWIAAPRKAIA